MADASSAFTFEGTRHDRFTCPKGCCSLWAKETPVTCSTCFWLAVGTQENWHTAFDFNGIWGLKATQEHYWDRMVPNSDLVFFYANQPVSGIVGYGIVRTKLKQKSPLWPQERAENRVIWPLRFEFDVLSCLAPSQWKLNRVGKEELRPRVRGGFQELTRDLAEQFMKALPPSVPSGLVLPQPIGLRDSFVRPSINDVPVARDLHDRLQGMVFEMGKLQRYVPEREFPIENRRLDVVWRRVQRSVPSYVFEIQVSGSLTEAIAKLKQAHDLWNSNIFLIGKEEHRRPAAQLAETTFHEIGGRLRFIEAGQVEELYLRKIAYREYEDQLGILG